MPTNGEVNSGTDTESTPTDAAVVETASAAAKDVVFSRLGASEVDDFDVTVTFDAGILDVDVYVNATGDDVDEGAVAEEAALAAQSSVDDLW